jgi:hypothetical protein
MRAVSQRDLITGTITDEPTESVFDKWAQNNTSVIAQTDTDDKGSFSIKLRNRSNKLYTGPHWFGQSHRYLKNHFQISTSKNIRWPPQYDVEITVRSAKILLSYELSYC